MFKKEWLLIVRWTDWTVFGSNFYEMISSSSSAFVYPLWNGGLSNEMIYFHCVIYNVYGFLKTYLGQMALYIINYLVFLYLILTTNKNVVLCCLLWKIVFIVFFFFSMLPFFKTQNSCWNLRNLFWYYK